MGRINSLHCAVIGVMSGLLLAFPCSAGATEVSREVTITSLVPIGHVRPAGPSSQGIVRVAVNSAPWGSTACRSDAVDISLEDWHLVALVTTAWKDERTITLYVDDTLKLVAGDTACRVTVAALQ